MKETSCNIVYAGICIMKGIYKCLKMHRLSPEEIMRNWQQCLSHKRRTVTARQRKKGYLYIPYIIQMCINFQIYGDILDIFL